MKAKKSPVLLLRQGVLLTWHNINVTSKKKSKKTKEITHILKNITGYVAPGQLIAIMGSSGAGKTTFLNTLANRNLRNVNISGKILVNGKLLDNDDMADISEYVQQDDLFYGEFTPREHLNFHANLRKLKEPQERISQVLEEMNLNGCQDIKIGQLRGKGARISGGERKRLSFATKILNQPALLFCDEPTSGLDSFLAHQVVSSLKRISSSGTTVLATIHQPSSKTFDLFDKILILCRGQCAFLGNKKEALSYFEKVLKMPCPKSFNPADHYIEVFSNRNENGIAPEDSDEVCGIICQRLEAYKTSQLYKNNESKLSKNLRDFSNFRLKSQNIKLSKRAPIFKQLKWLFWRSFIINYRNPVIIVLKIVQQISMAVVLGLIYLNLPYKNYVGVIENCDKITGSKNGAPITSTPEVMNINGAIFNVITANSFPGVFGVVNTFPIMLPAWREEYYGGLYSLSIAFLAENLTQLPLQIILPLISSSIFYFLFGLIPSFIKYMIFFLIYQLASQCAISFGYLMSSLSDNITIISGVTGAAITPLMIFGGFFLNARAIPVYFDWMKYISWFYYSNITIIASIVTTPKK